MDDDEDDVPTCPLCLEELDATDRAVKACQCGYQVCLWCLHHIREQLSARCPACRTPYVEQNFKFAEVNPEQAAKEAKERATAKKERERREKLKEIERERARAVAVSQQKAKNNLKHARILQRNLVYVIGLSLTLAREEVIRRADMFGKFGRMIRILVNRAHPFNADAPGGPSISAYVQYYRDSDASAAVRAMNNAVFDGREIRCAIATTKYCDVFVRSAAASDPNAAHHCGNPQCMYYHSISPQPDSVLTREEVLARQLGPPPPAHLFLDPRRPHMQTQFHRPGVSHIGPLPLAAAPNTTVSGAASVMPANRALSTRASPTPGSSAPMSSIAIHTSNQASNSNGTTIAPGFSNPNVASSAANPTNAAAVHANAATGQPPLVSSPRLRSTSVSGAARKSVVPPRAASPSASPQRTPPSSPGPRRSAPRLSRSPVRTEPTVSSSIAPGSALLTGSGAGTTTATSAPFFSPSSSNPQLPSTAGWGASHQGRSASRSPPRRGPSESMDDPARSRPRVQGRRRDNAPPGFEDSALSNAPSMPSRPPGFGTPGGNHSASRPQARSEVVRSATLPSMASGSPPPGFGPGPAAQRDARGEDPTLSDVAAAWSQEASTDEVFSTNDRRARRPVGEPASRTVHDVKGEIDARSELAQVLAKIGGDLGVSSEFQNVKTVTAPLAGPSDAVGGRVPGGDGKTAQPALGSLFGNQSFHGGYPSQSTTNSSAGEQRAQAPQSPVYGSTFSVPFARDASNQSRTEVIPSRRNNSRFGFARNEISEQKSRTVVAATPAPRPAVISSGEVKTPTRVVDKPDPLPSSNGVRSESHAVSDLTRNVSNQHPAVSVVPQAARQSRSRFGFADQATSPQKTQQVNRSAMDSAVHPTTAAETDPVSDAFGPTFANLSTAEKLASIFSSAQWSAERLPPMPTYDPQVDQVTSQRPDPGGASQGLHAANNQRVSIASNAVHSSSPMGDRTRTPAPSRSRPVQFAPPGFREATPGISPETTAVDETSTTTGVATSVASGGVVPGNAESATSGQTEESLSSGTESLEEDRKRSRAQRKRDKKARQLREAAERKAMESRAPRPAATVAESVETPAKAKDQRVVASSPGLREIKNPSPGQILTKPKGAPTQLKPTRESDDPARFMSVSELEREVEAARAREAQLQDRLLELQRRIRSYDNVRT